MSNPSDSDSSSSGGEVDDINGLLDGIADAKLDDIVNNLIKVQCNEIDSHLTKGKENSNYIHTFNSKIDSCLHKVEDTLKKWAILKATTSNGVVAASMPSSTAESSCDVISIKNAIPQVPKAPPIGAKVIKPPLKIGNRVFCMTSNSKSIWYPGYINDIYANKTVNEERYRVKVDRKKVVIRNFNGKSLAYMQKPNVILPIGTRIVAEYKEDISGVDQLSSFGVRNMYAGIIAEPPKVINDFQYLIFFDDGYAQYNGDDEVYLVCQSSEKVWEDVHPDSKEFIMDYLRQYPERPMVKLQRGQSVRTEWNGCWWNARVLAVNGSLAKMFFEVDKRTEWIYRGSTRLGPLFDRLMRIGDKKAPIRIKRQGLTSGVNAQRQPYIEYTVDDKDQVEKEPDESTLQPTTGTRNVAKKSSSKKSKECQEEQAEPISTGGTVEKIYVNIPMLPNYKKHTCCSPNCLIGSPDNYYSFKGTNPLEVPTSCDWRREIVKEGPGRKKLVFYVTPCGRRLRGIQDVNAYLAVTESKLTIDLFCFDSFVQTFQNYCPGNMFVQIKDISYGKENIPISCVNTVNKNKPEYVEYSTVRIPTKDVPLSLDENFLTCCDCTDNCRDKKKCRCHQLTIEAAKLAAGDLNPYIGYVNRRLTEQVFSGIYECNKKCKCNSQCMNRVVQNGLQNRLQLFKTLKKGWGLRTLDDIPRGGFICIYAGQLLTEHEANKDGTKYGDEYMAELDYIEVVENQHKDGYESDLPEDEMYRVDTDDMLSSDSDSSISNGSDKPPARHVSKRSIFFKMKNKAANKEPSEDEEPADKDCELPDLEDRSMGNIIKSEILVRPVSPNTEIKLNSLKLGRRPRLVPKSPISNGEEEIKYDAGDEPIVASPKPEKAIPSVRSLFGDDYCYVMDAKSCGNIGRYLNHSCAPNVFVQNVFVDSHDLRFPWVAFFAGKMIKAGKELTWDYNYEVGSVQGREIYCHCGSIYCRGRLL